MVKTRVSSASSPYSLFLMAMHTVNDPSRRTHTKNTAQIIDGFISPGHGVTEIVCAFRVVFAIKKEDSQQHFKDRMPQSLRCDSDVCGTRNL